MTAATSTLQVARLLTRFRGRYLWNALRSRRTRLPMLIVLVSLFSSLAYIGLFVQAFSTIVLATGVDGQGAVLALVASTIVCGALAAKAAASDAVLAGSPENEFLLSRPVSLQSLVVARSLAAAVSDPVGALFIFPVLLAAALTWRLPAWAWLVAALTSLLTQIAVAAGAQSVQILVVRVVPPRRRRGAWVVLRLLASLALASLWMTGTWVLRAPDRFARGVEQAAPLLAVSPGALVVRPLLALEYGSPAGAVLGLAVLAAVALLMVAVAARIAHHAGMHGWEEAGAAWAEADVNRAAPARHPPTAATKDLRLLLRDRSQLLALVAMPVIFVGIQIFGAAGWEWSTESVQRVSYLAFSLCLYMATIGPLAHMQAERRAFWIMLTVPVSMGRLMAAKARAWSVIVGGVAAVVFFGLSVGAPPVGTASFAGTAALVVGGAIGMTWLAVALACQAADLSDEHRPAVGPSTIYRFLLVGGLYNLVLAGDAETRVRGLILYAFTVAAFWATGMRQVTACLDPDAPRRRRTWLGDAATFAVCAFLGANGVSAALHFIGGQATFEATANGWITSAIILGLVATIYLARIPRLPPTSSLPRAVALALGAAVVLAVSLRGGAGAHAARGWSGLLQEGVASPEEGLLKVAATVGGLLGEEVVFRAVIQRTIAEHLGRPLLSAALSMVVAVVASPAGTPLGQAVSMHGLTALVWTFTQRTWPCVLTRLVMYLLLAIFPP